MSKLPLLEAIHHNDHRLTGKCQYTYSKGYERAHMTKMLPRNLYPDDGRTYLRHIEATIYDYGTSWCVVCHCHNIAGMDDPVEQHFDCADKAVRYWIRTLASEFKKRRAMKKHKQLGERG